MKIQELIDKLQEKNFNLLLFFFGISLLVFFPSYLNLNFFWDDERFIFLNPYFLQAPSPLSFWNPSSDFYKSWPIGYSFFWIIIKNFPNFGLFYYKTFNILIHAINAFLTFKVLKKFDLKYSFFLSTIFLIHPLHVETVSWVFQILTVLAYTFFCLSFLMIFKYFEEFKVKYLLICFLFFLCSIWTKSIAILYPFLLVYVFWLKKSSYKKYLLLIPFFLMSFYIGISNQKGIKDFNTSHSSHVSFFSGMVDSGVSSFFKKTESVKESEDKQYFDFLFNKKPIKDPIIFNRYEIFSQGSLHYLKKAVLPLKLQFIYPNQKPSFINIAIFLFIVLIVPIFLYIKWKDRRIVIIPVLSFVFLLPYLGLTFITFFYWSNVSDRYAYFFLLAIIIMLGIFLSRKDESFLVKKSLFVIIFIFSLQSFLYGTKFNNPLSLYEEIVTYKPHPMIYSLIFEEQIQRLQFRDARKTFDKAYKLYPNDPYILQDKFRIETLEKNQ